MTAAAPDWQTWYDAHATRLLLFARQWLPERADAEDAVQIGFVKFWRNRPRPAAAERAAAMQATLAGLPIEQREVVTLRIWGGLTFAGIALTLDANINTVTARFRSARDCSCFGSCAGGS